MTWRPAVARSAVVFAALYGIFGIPAQAGDEPVAGHAPASSMMTQAGTGTAGEQWVVGNQGIMRTTGSSGEPAPRKADAPGTAILQNASGQMMRVIPGVQPDPTSSAQGLAGEQGSNGTIDEPTRRKGEIPGTTVIQNGAGQRMRVIPGVQPDPTASAALSPIPPGATVVARGNVRMLRAAGVEDAVEANARTQANALDHLPPGVRIVDLPPGAVAPLGMPEPMTLYRVTKEPAAVAP